MIVSLIILILLSFGFLLGFKRGFTYQLIKMIGVFLIFFLATILKKPFGLFLYNHFDIFNLNKVVGIIVYQFISFFILFFILNILLVVLLKLSRVFESILKATIILGIPSKILGGLLGFIEYYIYIFVILLILNLPIFDLDLNNSFLVNFMLDKTPIISHNTNIVDELKDISNGDINDYEEMIQTLIDKKIINEKDINK